MWNSRRILLSSSSSVAAVTRTVGRHRGVAVSGHPSVSILGSSSSVLISNNHWQTNNTISSRGFSLASAAPAAPEEPSVAVVGESSQTKAVFVSTPERRYEYFTNPVITPEGVAVIKFDNPSKKVNTISFALKDEALQMWDKEIGPHSNVKSVVFSSAKDDCFIAGADIFDIQALENKQELLPMMEGAVAFFRHLKAKKVPLVAAIHGPALGGGLEWALWCDYRICTDSPKTKLGLPEVKLGLLPGFGGTQKLFPLVGLQAAMDMMLTGKDIRPDKAKKMGLVDLVVAQPSLEAVAIQTAQGLAEGSIQKSKPKKKSLVNRFIEDTPPGRNLMWKKVEEMVQKNTNGNYPSPLAIIECVKNGLEHSSDWDSRFKFEREQFVKLAETPESEGLIGIFDGMTKMKKHPFGDTVKPLEVKKVAVMGAGLMGAGIAQVTAEKGYQVLLKDRDDAAVARGQDYILGNWDKKLKRRRMTKYKHNIASTNVVPLTDETESWKRHFAGADMVIEAVFENLDLKRQIVQQVEEVAPERCIFATNTSAIPIADVAQGAKRPENIVGMHYFSPVPSMPLLEIIPHEGTSDSTKATAFAVGTKQGKTCIVVKDVPGFYVNRCLGPFLVEVPALIRDGVSLEQLDKAMKNFGMPVGPITLADEVGIDVSSHVAKFLSNADLGVRMEGGDISFMENMIEKGWLGRKSGQGFYTYNGKKKTINSEVQSYVKEFVVDDLKLTEKEIQDRMVCRFVNEAAKCLEDEIIADPVVGDIGLVFGIGFAPFRGGPFRYLDNVGVDNYVGMMNGFADTYGPQFEPCQLLKDYAVSGKKFHQ